MSDRITSTLYASEEPVSSYGIEVPEWIEHDISCATVAAIIEGGCDSGAYMPAVTYHDARETMSEHGDAVWSYLDDTIGLSECHPDMSREGAPTSWDGLACRYVSMAVELWASSIAEELAEAIENESRQAAETTSKLERAAEYVDAVELPNEAGKGRPMRDRDAPWKDARAEAQQRDREDAEKDARRYLYHGVYPAMEPVAAEGDLQESLDACRDLGRIVQTFQDTKQPPEIVALACRRYAAAIRRSQALAKDAYGSGSKAPAPA